MEELTQERRRPLGIRRVVVVVPSFFTLANLFFGFWSVIAAFSGNFKWAGYFIVFGGVLDMFDGRIARLSNTGTKFGAELDSLVDIVSFGVAPALLMYFLEFSSAGKFGWVVCYLYVVAAALRLARYNVIAHNKPHSSWFAGLPSPAAGMTLATYYVFSQTAWYRTTVPDYLDLQHEGLTVLVLLLGALMVSNVKYPRMPTIGVRSLGGIFRLVVVIGIFVGTIIAPANFLFPFFLTYMVFGIARSVVLSLVERRLPPGDPTTADSRPDQPDTPVHPLTPRLTKEGR